MENISRVTEHLNSKTNKIFPESLKLVKTLDEDNFHQDPNGNFWRVYNYIENAKSYEQIQSPQQAFEAAKAYGILQLELADLPGPELHETISDFHNTPKRYKDFKNAVIEGIPERVKIAEYEIKQANRLRNYAPTITNLIENKSIPLRVTHNDTKLNNVLLHNENQTGICVIDLDTLMSGSALYDFGDFVRSACRLGSEDANNLDEVKFSIELYEASLKGYLKSAGNTLNDVEKNHLALSSVVITYEVALRFLTDYLTGDPYFKITHETHNLERARVHLKLAKEIKKHFNLLNSMINK
jgi:thiamine kinase-like enzyme